MRGGGGGALTDAEERTSGNCKRTTSRTILALMVQSLGEKK